MNAVLTLWYAQVSWAKELIVRSFGFERAEDILLKENRGNRQIPGTNWYFRTHGVGVDIYKTLDVGGVDFDFDKPHPDAWRIEVFIRRQVNDGNLPFEAYREALDDDQVMEKIIAEILSSNA